MSTVIKLSSPATKQFWEVPVVYEDEHLLALDKPSRLLTSPDRYDPDRPNLMKLLHRDIARGAAWVREKQITYLANAHRLDFETSGVLLLARSKPVLIRLADQFGSERPLKTYVALVQGEVQDATFEVDAKIGPHPTRIGLMRIDEKRGKKSRTVFEVRERFSRYTLLTCRPATGRTHQIRIHLRWVQLPIVGDALYGGRPLLLSSLKRNYRLKGNDEEKPLMDRVALHAERLQIAHPVTGEQVSMEAAWPRDLSVAVKYLRRYAVGQAVTGEPEVSPDERQ